MRTAVEHVVGMRMGVAADPEVDRPWMRGEITLERLRLRLVAEEVEIGSALRRAVRAVISAGPERAVRIAAHTLVVARADRGLAQHVVRAGDDDLVLAGAFHMRRPPREGLGRDRARGRGAAARPPPDRIGQVIAVAHHQEADIADLEGVALPGAVDRARTLGAWARAGGGAEPARPVLIPFARALVGPDLLSADAPQIKPLPPLMPSRRSRLRDRGGDRGRERGGARLEQSPPRGGNRIGHRFLSVCAHVDLAVSADRRIATILIGGLPV